MSLRTLTLLLCLLAGGTGCTVVKPLVCTITHPIHTIREDLDEEDDDDEEHAKLQPAFAIPVIVVLLPVRYAYLTGAGAVGGLFSGLASDMNFLTGNYDAAAENLTRAFRTNAAKPSD